MTIRTSPPKIAMTVHNSVVKLFTAFLSACHLMTFEVLLVPIHPKLLLLTFGEIVVVVKWGYYHGKFYPTMDQGYSHLLSLL